MTSYFPRRRPWLSIHRVGWIDHVNKFVQFISSRSYED